MEKIYSERATKARNKQYVAACFSIDLSCCFCMTEETITGDTEKEVLQKMVDAGWRDINSDDFAVIGNYCGCKYKETY